MGGQMIIFLIILGIILLTPLLLIIKNLAVCWWRAVVESWIDERKNNVRQNNKEN